MDTVYTSRADPARPTNNQNLYGFSPGELFQLYSFDRTFPRAALIYGAEPNPAFWVWDMRQVLKWQRGQCK